ncbi:MAG: amidohydrolase family protein, partial [Candidatus Curtissbacteria bacterium]
MPKLDPILKLPGLVDIHVHLREPGNTHKEDFQTGTAAAVAGGYTQILDMPNNTPPTTTPEALDEKIKLAHGRIWCDLGFNFGATRESIKYFERISKKAFGLKVYMNQTTGPLLIENSADREEIFKSWNSLVPIMVHAEGETVEITIKLAKKYKKPLHICHVTADQISSVEKAKKEGLSITCEVCPHHLFLDQSDLEALGPFGMMKPPLLTPKDRQKLWDNLDKIDMIATDHAPHTKEEKLDTAAPYFGVPGLETTLPLMLQAVAGGLLSISRLKEMLCDNPRRVF